VVTTDTAFPKFAKIYADTPLETLKAWQAFNVADGARRTCPSASWTPTSPSAARSCGQPEQKPRWKRGVAFMDNADR
jgi:putative endopeptidase